MTAGIYANTNICIDYYLTINNNYYIVLEKSTNILFVTLSFK